MENQTQNELMKVVDSSGLESQTSDNIKSQFLPMFEQAENWKIKAMDLVVTDINQVAEMQMARVARLALKDIRVNADKTRKALKEDSLRYGKAVQGVYNVLEYLIVPIEKHLEEQEKFAEVQEAKRKADLKVIREMELKPFAEFVPFNIEFGEITEEDYLKILNGAMLQSEASIKEKQKIAEENAAKERAELEERNRVRLENESLAKENAELEAKRKAEREEAEKAMAAKNAEIEAQVKKLEAENKAKEEKRRLELNAIKEELKAKEEEEKVRQKALKDKHESELRLQKQKEAEEKKAAKAPIKTKMSVWVDSFVIASPIGLESEPTVADIMQKFEDFKKWAKSQIEKQ